MKQILTILFLCFTFLIQAQITDSTNVPLKADSMVSVGAKTTPTSTDSLPQNNTASSPTADSLKNTVATPKHTDTASPTDSTKKIIIDSAASISTPAQTKVLDSTTKSIKTDSVVNTTHSEKSTVPPDTLPAVVAPNTPPPPTNSSASNDIDTTLETTLNTPLIPEDTIKAVVPPADALVDGSNSDAILTDCVIGDSACLPDVVIFENNGNTMVSAPANSENSVENYMNSDEVNPYKFSATTVPKGAIINIIDSGMPDYLTPCYCSVNSPFGYRRWGRYYQFHPGIDLNLPYGQPARAAFNGVVRFAKMTPGYGNCVIIRHPNGLETLYGHFSELAVVAGQEVKAGDVVGYCGNTGYSFGAHLHFEIRYLGVPFDPAQIVYTQADNLKIRTITIDDALFRSNTPPPPPKYKYVYHVVKKGESLSVIARKYGVSVTYLCKLNRITVKTILKPGRTLRIR